MPRSAPCPIRSRLPRGEGTLDGTPRGRQLTVKIPTDVPTRPLLREIALLRLAFLGFAWFALAASSVSAADTVFPPGSHIGLAPPAGVSVSRTFPGFADPEKKVSFLFTELPGGAYEEFVKGMTTTAKSAPGVSAFRQEVLLTQNGAATLIVADQESQGEKFRKWLLVTRNTVSDRNVDISRAYVVTVQVPAGASSAYPDEAIRKSLATLTLRDEIPNEETLSLLPFRMTDLAKFRYARPVTPGRAVVLTDEEKMGTAPEKHAYMFVSIGQSPQIQPDERERFARNLLSGISGYSDLRVTFAEPQRIGNFPGYEIRLEGKDDRTKADVALVQWVRFSGGAVLRMVGIAPKDAWLDSFARFRAVRDGIEPR